MILNKTFVPLAQTYVKEELNLNNELCRCLPNCVDFELNNNSYFHSCRLKLLQRR
jgi:hypothetical protein